MYGPLHVELCLSQCSNSGTCDVSFLNKLFKNESYFCYYLQDFILL